MALRSWPQMDGYTGQCQESWHLVPDMRTFTPDEQDSRLGMTIDLLEPVASLEEIEGSAVFLPS